MDALEAHHDVDVLIQFETQCPVEKTNQEENVIYATLFPPCDPILHNILVLQDFYRESIKSLVTVPTESAPYVEKMLL